MAPVGVVEEEEEEVCFILGCRPLGIANCKMATSNLSRLHMLAHKLLID